MEQFKLYRWLAGGRWYYNQHKFIHGLPGMWERMPASRPWEFCWVMESHE